MSDSYTRMFTCKAGALLRDNMIAEMRRASWDYNVTITVDEARYWLYSQYKVTMVGDKKNVDRYEEALDAWIGV